MRAIEACGCLVGETVIFSHLSVCATTAVQGAAYQTGDFRDYLPPEAGGRAGSRPHSALSMAAGGAAAAAGDAQRLGHILYVRDSSSDHDSDEDPDDDLDI